MATINIDLNSILQQTAGIISQNGIFAEQVSELNKQGSDITQQRQKAAQEAASAAGQVTEATLRAKQAEESAALNIANSLGTNASGNSWLIKQYADTIVSKEAEAQKHLDIIKKKQSVTFFDNPLGYLLSQATIDGDIANYKAAVDSSAVAKNAATSLQSISDSAVIAQSRLNQTVTEAGIANSKIIAGYQYKREADSAAMDGIRFNLEGIERLRKVPLDNLNLLYSARGALMQERSYAMDRERLSLARAEAAERAKAREEKLDEDNFIVKNVAKGFHNLTGQELPESKVKDIKFLMKTDPKFQAYFESGIQSFAADSSGRAAIISTSPSKVLAMQAGGTLSNLNQGTKQTVTEITNAYSEFKLTKEYAAVKQSGEKGAEANAFDRYVLNKFESQAKSGDARGIYAITDFNTLAKLRPEIAELPVYKSVIAPLVAAGLDTKDTKLITTSVANAVSEGKLSYNDALQLSSVYGLSMRASYELNNLKAFNLPAPTKIETTLNATGLPFGSASVNLTDQRSFATFLNKQLAMRKASEAMLPNGNGMRSLGMQ
jgi:hypothetical protein